MKECILYKKLKNNKARCNLCYRYCNLGENQIGFCGVRKNIKGKIYLLVYGKPSVMHLDPIEKKPLFHFHPGSFVFSIGTIGCNFNCQYCQNWDLSREKAIENIKNISPGKIVSLALQQNAKGISYTYNEPTIFLEYALDIAKIARKKALFNTFVSNGYMTKEVVNKMKGYIDAVTIDFKANGNDNFAKKYISIVSEKPIYDTLLELKKSKIFIEITDLIVPGIGDNLDDAKKLVLWIIENLGDETPIHFLGFHPAYKMLDVPRTEFGILEKHYKLAKELGMKYVYLGNINKPNYENTYCPKCNSILIKRDFFSITKFNLTESKECPKCKTKINILD
ncbi:MAG: AmmeMemoRadiSam system radical SAM enzyme [Candidatus Marsarchaeota archaeon]|nr:AmmeMemoRadiSam system radical SAM enzyme [Candidatus Marsarchaeota archaeon]MCL5095099.1 AmmeMemoRadiSam system radical SAM enzyme [Candidatus Marsarchaeota archaeon]